MRNLSGTEAREVALAAAGFSGELKTPSDALSTLGLFQLDTVNVFQRAHLMPAFSRVGPYPAAEFQTWAFGHGENRELEETWAHCAALVPKSDWGLFEFRRAEYRARPKFIERFREHKNLVGWIAKEIEGNGPMLVGDFEHEQNKRKGDWWGWSDVKVLLESMWFTGELVADGRIGFSRRYALPSQVKLEPSDLSEHEQKLELVRKAAASLGVATLAEIADYYRFYPTEARPLVNELVAAGDLVETKVEGWEKPAFTPKEIPSGFDLGERRLRLLSPFDPIVWHRARAKAIFGFDYQIEIYVPAAKRKFGYYTLPLLFDDRLVGKVDLKHDRKTKTLETQALWAEEGVSKKELTEITPHLVAELKLAADWVGAEKVNPPLRGNWPLGRI